MRAVVLWCSPPTRKSLRESLCARTRARRITIPYARVLREFPKNFKNVVYPEKLVYPVNGRLGRASRILNLRSMGPATPAAGVVTLNFVNRKFEQYPLLIQAAI